jgi:hypothetical protein
MWPLIAITIVMVILIGGWSLRRRESWFRFKDDFSLPPTGPKNDSTARDQAIVIITFGEEKDLLEFQSHSFQKYLDPSLVQGIHLVYNDNDYASFCQWADTHLRYPVPVYIHSYREYIPFQEKSSWHTQQVLKLLCCKSVQNKYMISLDTKVFLIRPLRHSDLFQGHCPLVEFRKPHEEAFRIPQYTRACEYFGVDSKRHSLRAASVPPVVMQTTFVCDMVKDIERREGKPLLTWFLETRGIYTEYLLYQAYMIKRNAYDVAPRASKVMVGFWIDAPSSQEGIMKRIGTLRTNPSIRMVSIHRRIKFPPDIASHFRSVLQPFLPGLSHPRL